MNLTHNHERILSESHSFLRKIATTQKIQNTIINQTRIESRPSQILSFLRLNIDEKDLIFKSYDVYNIKNKIKNDALETLISI